MMQVEYEGEKYTFDLEEATTDQLINIQKVFGTDMHLLGLAQGMRDGDIRAMTCVWWLIQVQNGKDLLRLQTVKLEKPVKFAAALMVSLVKEQAELMEKAEKALAEEKDSPKD